MLRLFLIAVLVALLPGLAVAQVNFEIQVYGSETVAPGTTMVELHSNSAIQGTTRVEDGVLPTQNAIHETIEITHGWTSWFKGPGTKTGIEFTPAAKVSYDLTKVVSPGIEYYGTLGPVGNFLPASRQQQQLYGVVDLNVDPRWEINFGIGGGLTLATDGLIIKMILGRRF